ncbi:MAG: type II CAAX endopeptidase family protein [Bacteroidia bacterium]
MKNNQRITFGLVITIAIFLTSKFVSSKIHLNSEWIPDTFISLSIILLLSVIAICVMRKDLDYKISFPKLNTVIKPIVIALVATILINILMTLVTKLAGGKDELHPAFLKMSWKQIFVFVFIYASIAEEILFRGFLLNSLKSLKPIGVTFFKRRINLSVIISALAFGSAHLTLISTGVDSLFVMRIVLFATCLGIIAGYYQEKYDNNAYAIIVHMSGNSIAVIGSFLMSLGIR